MPQQLQRNMVDPASVPRDSFDAVGPYGGEFESRRRLQTWKCAPVAKAFGVVLVAALVCVLGVALSGTIKGSKGMAPSYFVNMSRPDMVSYAKMEKDVQKALFFGDTDAGTGWAGIAEEDVRKLVFSYMWEAGAVWQCIQDTKSEGALPTPVFLQRRFTLVTLPDEVIATNMPGFGGADLWNDASGTIGVGGCLLRYHRVMVRSTEKAVFPPGTRGLLKLPPAARMACLGSFELYQKMRAITHESSVEDIQDIGWQCWLALPETEQARWVYTLLGQSAVTLLSGTMLSPEEEDAAGHTGASSDATIKATLLEMSSVQQCIKDTLICNLQHCEHVPGIRDPACVCFAQFSEGIQKAINKPGLGQPSQKYMCNQVVPFCCQMGYNPDISASVCGGLSDSPVSHGSCVFARFRRVSHLVCDCTAPYIAFGWRLTVLSACTGCCA